MAEVFKVFHLSKIDFLFRTGLKRYLCHFLFNIFLSLNANSLNHLP